MRAEYEDTEVDIGVRGELAQRPVEMTVIGARGGNDAMRRLEFAGIIEDLANGWEMACRASASTEALGV